MRHVTLNFTLRHTMQRMRSMMASMHHPSMHSNVDYYLTRPVPLLRSPLPSRSMTLAELLLKCAQHAQHVVQNERLSEQQLQQQQQMVPN